MREILFKGKRLDNGEWVEGYLINFWDEYCIVNTDSRDICFKVDPETVGQFTGYTDKNGKKIFEGDIVQGTITSRWDKRLIRCEVVFENGCFISVEKSVARWEHKLRFAKDIEVIGNIHDNPELLEG